MDQLFHQIITELSSLKEVEGILLSGSRTNNCEDELSDYDVYVYLNQMIDLDIRQNIISKYCDYMELGNSFWELEDDCILNNGIVIELIYRDTQFIDDVVGQVISGSAQIGYTTCFWYNLLHSVILYDRQGRMNELKAKYDVPYPEELKNHIIEKNLPLLKGFIPSYYEQIEKAIKRNDLISINHRISEFLASYFDILFAYNKQLHPGEKRLVMQVKKMCKTLPLDFESNLESLIKSIGTDSSQLLMTLNNIIEQLNIMIKK